MNYWDLLKELSTIGYIDLEYEPESDGWKCTSVSGAWLTVSRTHRMPQDAIRDVYLQVFPLPKKDQND